VATTSPPHSEPPRKIIDKHIIWAVVLLIGFIIASGIFMVWFGLRILSHGVHAEVTESSLAGKVITVKTPVGDFRISKEQNVSDLELGLPLYPGATRLTDSRDENSVSLAFDLPDQTNLQIAVAKFDTLDPMKKVREFYKQQLGEEVSSFIQTDRNGKSFFELKRGEENKFVSLEPHNGETRIVLVRIFHGRAEPN
jgi:hypothetical protein